MVPVPPFTTEAQKTEPDKNTYLVFRDSLSGADASYDYGRRLVHPDEIGPGSRSGSRCGRCTRWRRRPRHARDVRARLERLGISLAQGMRDFDLVFSDGSREPIEIERSSSALLVLSGLVSSCSGS
jgi:hypothetical protein